MRISKAPEERRAELVAAARALLDEKGVAKTRVSDIVKRVGVAQGVFYYYFKSKDEVVDVVVAQTVEEVAARRDAILQGESPVAARLCAYIRLYADWIDGLLADNAHDTAPLHEGPLAHSPLVKAGRTLLDEGFVALVQAAGEKGELALPYPAQSAKVLLYGLQALARESLPGADVVYALAEQALGLAPGALAAGEPAM